MKLAQYLKRHDLTDAEFARRCEVPRSAVHKWLRGAVPSPPHMRAVYRASGGAVAPNDFYGLRKRAGRDLSVDWQRLEDEFLRLDSRLAKGDLTPEEHRQAVANLEQEVRQELDLGEAG